jgi:Family of unknown function (DUF5706)
MVNEAPRQVTQDDIANLIATYDTNAEWIRFADAKAGAVLTVNGVLASFLIPTLNGMLDAGAADRGWRLVEYVLFGLWALVAVGSSVSAFRCIVPFRPRGRHPTTAGAPHFHSASTARQFAIDAEDEFVRSYERLDPAGIRREILVALLIDAHVAEAKYRWVRRAVQLLGVVAVTGFGYLAVLQVAG